MSFAAWSDAFQGYLAVYNVKQALDSGEAPSESSTYFHPPTLKRIDTCQRSDIFPTHSIVHQSAIRALAWIRVPPTDSDGFPRVQPIRGPNVIASGGYDGVECLTDIWKSHDNVVNRTRGAFNLHHPVKPHV